MNHIHNHLHLDRTYNNHGGSAFEIQTVTSICYLSLLILNYIPPLPSKTIYILLEMCLLLIPQILAILFPHWIWTIITTLSFLYIALYLLSTSSKKEHSLGFHRIDILRGLIIFQTCISIFAVDFAIYPPRFMKTESAGISLMDVGVGCYAFMTGMGLSLYCQTRKSPTMPFKRTIQKSIWLLVLGLGRTFFIHLVGYHENVSEYGIHWNFFLTLFVISWSMFLLCHLLSPKFFPILSVLLVFTYQFCLSQGLQKYICSNIRTDVISMNKEGIFGCIGYLVLSIMGFWITHNIQWKEKAHRNLSFLFMLCSFFWITYNLTSVYIAPSRRSNNLPFVLWILAFTTSHMLLTLTMDSMNLVKPTILFHAVNRNPLITFIFANLLTGLLNLTRNTLLVPPSLALVYIFAYTISFSLLAVVLDVNGIKIQ